MRQNVTETYVIEPVLKALRVLEAVAASPVPLTLKQVAMDTDLPKTTAFKHVHTLRRAGYLSQEESDDRISLGVRFWLLAGRGSPFAQLREIALPIMTKLRDEFGETINLATLEGDEIVYVAVVESRRSLRTHAREGGSDPAVATAVGRAMLAELPDVSVRKALPPRLVAASTGKPISQRAIATIMADVRRQGFALDDGDSEEGVRCVGVASNTPDGWPMAGLSLSGPITRIAAERVPEIAASLRVAAAELAEKLR